MRKKRVVHAKKKKCKAFPLLRSQFVMTAGTLIDEILEEASDVNRKYLPGRKNIVEISVLACTDKGGECMS